MSLPASPILSVLLSALVALLVATDETRSDEVILQAPGPLGPLEGAYRAAKDANRRVVLIIPGSGPTDRDGNNPLGVAAATYRYLAEDLAKSGIGSIRIDKRGLFGSKAAISDANDVTLNDYADDIHAWIGIAKEEIAVRCLWLLGHSEGALVALLSAQRKGAICGLILAASPGRRLAEILRQQLQGLLSDQSVRRNAFDIIDRLEKGQRVDPGNIHPTVRQLFAPRVQGFMMNLMSHDPAGLIAKVSVPVLILQGKRDIQVNVSDAKRLHSARPEARLALIPDMNHVLKTVDADDRKANIATYADPSLPLAPGVIDAIVNFITDQETR